MTPELISRIEIVEPKLSSVSQEFRRWSYEGKFFDHYKWMEKRLRKARVRPRTHPRAIDLCAGDGSVANFLLRNGWLLGNIACVDLYKSPTPLIPEGVKWLYWDLAVLAEHLLKEESLPELVEAHRGEYDLVCLFQGHINEAVDIFSTAKYEGVICSFFKNPQTGVVIHL